MAYEFMAGTMGAALGEGIVAAARLAVLQGAPLIVFTASGGARMQEGILALMQMARTVVAYEALADAFANQRLNSPNDAVFHQNGDLYFTDPPYGLTRKLQDPEKDLPFQGVYRCSKDGEVTLLTKQLSRPNGVAFSPDYRTLYVANSDPARAVWTAFPVLDNGQLGDGRVLFDATHLVPRLKGLPDGLKVDRHGNLFATGPGGVLVLTPTRSTRVDSTTLVSVRSTPSTSDPARTSCAPCRWRNAGPSRSTW